MIREYFYRGLTFPISFFNAIIVSIFNLFSFDSEEFFISFMVFILMPFTHLFGYYLFENPPNIDLPEFDYRSLKEIINNKKLQQNKMPYENKIQKTKVLPLKFQEGHHYLFEKTIIIENTSNIEGKNKISKAQFPLSLDFPSPKSNNDRFLMEGEFMIKEYFSKGLKFPILFSKIFFKGIGSLMLFDFTYALISLWVIIFMPITHLFGYYFDEINSTTEATYQSLRFIVKNKRKY